MVWFRVDDGWHKHRKRIRAGLDLEGMAAQGLWAAAGSWCSDELSDGFIPDDVVDYLAPGVGQMLAKRLEAARLWVRGERDGESGWQFHQWVEQQPTRDEVEAVASKKSSGGKLGNHRRWHVQEGKADPACPYCRAEAPPAAKTRRPTSNQSADRSSDRRSDKSSKSGANPPTRPDPTLFQTPSESAEPTSSDAAGEPEELTETQRSKRITDAYAEVEPMCKWPAVNGVVLKAIKSGRFADVEIHQALLRMAKDGRSVTVDALRTELQGFAVTNNQPRSGSRNQPQYQNPKDPNVYKDEWKELQR